MCTIEKSWIEGLYQPAGIVVSNHYMYVSSVTRFLIYKIKCDDASYESWKPIFSFCNSLSVYKDTSLYACSFLQTNMEKIDLYQQNCNGVNIELSTPCYDTYHNPFGLAIQDDYLFVSNQQGNFISQINLLEDPDSVFLSSWVSLNHKPYYLASNNNYLYISNYDDNSISCIHISTKKLYDNILSNLHGPLGLVLHDEYLYVANKVVGVVRQYSVKDPLKPVLLNASVIEGLNSPYGLAIQGNYLYVTNFDSGTIDKIQVYEDFTMVAVEEPFVDQDIVPLEVENEMINEEVYELKSEEPEPELNANFEEQNNNDTQKKRRFNHMIHKRRRKLIALYLNQKNKVHKKFEINRIDSCPFTKYTNDVEG